MDFHDREEIIRRYVVAYNAMDVEGMASELTEDITISSISSDIYDDSSIEGRILFCEQEYRNLIIVRQRQMVIEEIFHTPEDTRIKAQMTQIVSESLSGGINPGDTLNATQHAIYTFNEGRISSILKTYS